MSKDRDIKNFIRDMERRHSNPTPADQAKGGKDPLEQVWKWSGDYQGAFSPDTDAAWQRFKADNIKKTGAQPLRVAKRPAGRWWAYAAAVLLLIGGVGIWKSYFRTTPMLLVQSGEDRREVLLADGSTVVLNSNSALRYPADLATATLRKVELTGEAYFDVAHDEGRRFVIHTPAAEIAVLGTSFNLRAVPGEASVEVEVESGLVEMRPLDGGRIARIRPAQRGIYSAASGLSIRKEPALNAQAWRTGKLIFVGRPVHEAVTEIGRYYGADIDLSKSNISDCPFTSNFDKVPLVRALEALSMIYGASVVQKDATHFIIQGGNCNR